MLLTGEKRNERAAKILKLSMKRESTFGRIGGVLSDEISLRILGMLSKKPLFVKNIAHSFGMHESHTSERISSMRKLGLIDYRWVRVNDRNVKEYFLTTKKIEISFSSGEPSFVIKKKDYSAKAHSLKFIDFSPPKIKTFVGREEELRALKEKSKVFISGISGIGKTSLAAKYTSGLKEPVFWHTIREVDSLEYLLTKISSFLDHIGRKNLSRMIAIGASKRMVIDYCISEMRKVNSVIVIDDFQLCSDKNITGLIRDISLSEPSLKIIVISKEVSPPTNGYFVLNLKGLNFDESRALLSGAGKKHDATTISSLGGYPLALSLVGKISEEKITLETLTSVLATEIVEYLDNSGRETLLWAAAFREAFSLEELNYALERDAGSDLQVLVNKGLISTRSRSYYVHEFVRSVAASLQGAPRVIHTRLGNYYASDHSPTSTIEAIYHFGESGESGSLIKLIKTNAALLVDSGFSEPLLTVLNHLKKIERDPIARGWILLWVAKIEQMGRNYTLAMELSEEIIGIAKNADEELGIRASLWLGQTLNTVGKNDASLKILQKSLTVTRRKLSKEDLEADILYSLNWTLCDLGKLDSAQSYLSQAIEIYGKIGDKRNYYAAIFYRGYNDYLRGKFESAIKDMDVAYSGLFEMNRIISAAACLLHKAFALWRQGDSRNAILILSKSIQMYRDQNERLGEEHLRLSLSYRAIINSFKGKIERAEKDLAEAESFRRGKDDNLANMSEGMARGIINAHKKNWLISDHNFAVAERAAEIEADHYFLCEAKKWRGWMLMQKGSVRQAMKKFEEVRSLAVMYGMKVFLDDIAQLIAESKK